MSIAVSAVVKPSGFLLTLTAAMCVGAIAIGVVTGSGMYGDVLPVTRIAIGGACIGAALFVFFRGMNARKTLRLDISGIGQIRLTDDKGLAGISAAASIDAAHCELVNLMPGSTLWPMLLLLRLKSEDGRTRVLRILPDSVAPETLRRLSVACRWIAAHNQADKPTISQGL